jgi:hypothetical protein
MYFSLVALTEYRITGAFFICKFWNLVCQAQFLVMSQNYKIIFIVEKTLLFFFTKKQKNQKKR